MIDADKSRMYSVLQYFFCLTCGDYLVLCDPYTIDFNFTWLHRTTALRTKYGIKGLDTGNACMEPKVGPITCFKAICLMY